MDKKDIKSWCTAATVAIGAAVAVSMFVVRIGTFTSPVDGDAVCAVAKVKALWSVGHGTRVLAKTPRGTLIQRVFALPGDTVSVVNGSLIVNGERTYESRRATATYHLMERTPFSVRRQMKEQGETIDSMTFRLNVRERESNQTWRYYTYTRPMPNEDDARAYPHDVAYQWNAYHWGPMRLPRRGDVIRLNYKNFKLYGQMIKDVEGHEVSMDNMATYTFEHDYYFLLLPNRDIMDDSRAFGPVPEDDILGRAILIRE